MLFLVSLCHGPDPDPREPICCRLTPLPHPPSLPAFLLSIEYKQDLIKVYRRSRVVFVAEEIMHKEVRERKKRKD